MLIYSVKITIAQFITDLPNNIVAQAIYKIFEVIFHISLLAALKIIEIVG
jgi:hypothetical protein